MFLSLPAVTIAYALGIFLGSILALKPTALLAFCTLLFFLVIGQVRRKGEVGLLLFLLLILLGMFRYQLLWQRPSILDNFQGKEVVATGIVVEEPALRGDRLSFNLKLDAIEYRGEPVPAAEEVLVQVRGWAGEGIVYGDRLQLRGRVQSPAQPANFGEFNYNAYLRRMGIKYLLLPRPQGLRVISRGEGNPLVALALRVKKLLLGVIEATLPPDQGRVLQSLLFGERVALEPDVLQDFEKSGVVHLLAVSGLHVGFVAGLGFGLGRLLAWSPRFTALVSGLIVALYLLVIGFRASVLRAGIMLWVGIAGLLLNRRADSLTALSAAGLFLLLVRPGFLFTPGFQLSFGATWGILYLFPLLARALSFLPRWLANSFAVSAAAQLATEPILAYHFYGFAPWSVFNNLVAVPLAGVIMGLGLVSCGAGLVFLPLARILAAANGILITVLQKFIALAASLPLAYLYLPPPGPLFLAAYYALLVLLPRLFPEQEKEGEGKAGAVPYRAAALVLVSILLFSWILSSLNPHQLEVTFLSVGAGDAVVVTLPGGRTCLIDTGPGGLEEGFDAGAGVIIPYLRRQGVRRLDLIFLTHPHQDHAGGLAQVTAGLTVGGIVFPRIFSPGEFGLSPDSAIPLFGVVAGDRLDLGRGVECTVLHPPPTPLTGTNDDYNNNSLVLLLKMGAVSFLFTGDLEGAGENYMLQYNRVSPATVLKVAHHGARNSTGREFLGKIKPSLAVISTGPNSFGHPHRETLERLDALGVKTFRTDVDGAIRIRTDGKRVWLEKARGKENDSKGRFPRPRR